MSCDQTRSLTYSQKNSKKFLDLLLIICDYEWNAFASSSSFEAEDAGAAKWARVITAVELSDFHQGRCRVHPSWLTHCVCVGTQQP